MITPLIVGIIAIAYFFDFFNGFHDAANSISTVVSTRVLAPLAAVSLAALFNFVAFLVFGVAVAKLIKMSYSLRLSGRLSGTSSRGFWGCRPVRRMP